MLVSSTGKADTDVSTSPNPSIDVPTMSRIMFAHALELIKSSCQRKVSAIFILDRKSKENSA